MNTDLLTPARHSIPNEEWASLNGGEVAYLRAKFEASSREQAEQATCPLPAIPAAAGLAASAAKVAAADATLLRTATPAVGKAGQEKKKANSMPMRAPEASVAAAVAPGPSPKKELAPPSRAPAPTRSAPEKGIAKKTKAEEVRSGKKEAEEVKSAKKEEVVAANKEAEEPSLTTPIRYSYAAAASGPPPPPCATAAKGCSVCGVRKPKEAFSKKQWGLTDTARKCSECVTSAAARDEASLQAAKVGKAPPAETKLYKLYEIAWAVGLLAAFVWLMYDGGLKFLPQLGRKS
jgi:hypothetical protein